MSDQRLPDRRGQLALRLQEAFTAGARLRAGRDVAADATAFRAHAKRLIAQADREARQLGYAGADVGLAVYAFVVYLDEAVLTSNLPAFAEWPRMPLQEEVFGDHMGGRTFFENMRGLLARENSDDVADVLEVYQLCLLLGFRGQYSAGGGGEIQALTAAADEKIQRIRGTAGDLVPTWRLPAGERAEVAPDRWLPRLKWSALAAFGLALLLFALYALALRSGVSRLVGMGS
jgi:type VI secretion system protein ImpK